MMKPLFDAKAVRAFRTQHGLTQEELATLIGFNGTLRRQHISKIEAGTDTLDPVRANLLRAIEGGYSPIWESQPDLVTPRQAEALWAAKHHGKANTLATTEKGVGGGFRRMLRGLLDAGLLADGMTITKAGEKALAAYEAHHKLNPKIKRR